MTVNYAEIKRLRNERGYTQAHVAAFLGFASAQAYFYKETGQRDITADELGALAVLYDVPVDTLYQPDPREAEHSA